MTIPVVLEDVVSARRRIADHVHRTPLRLLDVPGLHHLPVYAKCEHLQVSGSFKMRGAASLILRDLCVPGLVTGSSGNHGIAASMLAACLGIPATVVMTEQASAYRRRSAG